MRELTRSVPGELGAVIKVVGIGSAGVKAVNQMIRAGLREVTLATVDSDTAILPRFETPSRRRPMIELPGDIPRGITGRDAARWMLQEKQAVLAEFVADADLVFIVAGMGGATGTGGAPVVARLARQAGALTAGVVTRPFTFEGQQRAASAEAGIKELERYVDALVIIPGDRLLEMTDRQKATITDARHLGDDILQRTVAGILDSIRTPCLISLDFADIKSLLSLGKGSALRGMFSMGWASGDHRVAQATEMAFSSPLLERPLSQARGALMLITGVPQFPLSEAMKMAESLAGLVNREACLFFNLRIDPDLEHDVRLTIIGFYEMT